MCVVKDYINMGVRNGFTWKYSYKHDNINAWRFIKKCDKCRFFPIKSSTL